jgi:acetate kinase
MKILTINSGSTSIKFKLYEMPQEKCLASGKIEGIGQKNATFSFGAGFYPEEEDNYDVPNHKAGLKLIIDKLSSSNTGVIKNKKDIDAIGHRVVNIGDRAQSYLIINDKVLNDIKECVELAPLHNLHNLLGIEVCRDIFNGVPNIAIFDNIFHKDMLPRAYLYGIPYDYYEKYRIRKYGFHGIAYTYMVERVSKLLNKDLKDIKIIAIMLGGGSSITAVKNGIAIDTSMGFTPAEGLFMSTRSGDLDPAIITYIMKKDDLNPYEIDEIINKKSGLLGLSKKYKDYREIEKGVREDDENCIRAFDSYVYKIKKYIGSYIAAMDGVDAIVYGGGIGENSSITREAILDGFSFIGLKLDKNKNNSLKDEGFISTADSKVAVLVVNVDEEIVIARETYGLVRNLFQIA